MLLAQPLVLWDEVPACDSENSDHTKYDASLPNNIQLEYVALVNGTYKIEIVSNDRKVERGYQHLWSAIYWQPSKNQIMKLNTYSEQQPIE